MTAVALASATAAKCSAPKRPAITVSIVPAPMMDRFAMKIGVASFSMALNPISGGVMRCGVAPLISEVLMKLNFELEC